MKYRIAILILVLFLASLSLSGCEEKDSFLSVAENTTERPLPDLSKPTVIVNISSKTVHSYATCRFVQNAKKENLRYLSVEENTLSILQSMEYSFCSACRDPH